MVEPPLSTGAVKVMVPEALPRSADPIVGTPGTVAGVTEPDGSDGSEVPTLLVTWTVKV